MDTQIIITEQFPNDFVWIITHPNFVIYSKISYLTQNICKRWAKYHHTKLFKPYAIKPYRRLSPIENANLERMISYECNAHYIKEVMP